MSARHAGRLLAMLLVGLGFAVIVRTALAAGLDHFALGYVVGPGLIGAGVARLKLDGMLERGHRGTADAQDERQDERQDGRGGDGAAT